MLRYWFVGFVGTCYIGVASWHSVGAPQAKELIHGKGFDFGLRSLAEALQIPIVARACFHTFCWRSLSQLDSMSPGAQDWDIRRRGGVFMHFFPTHLRWLSCFVRDLALSVICNVSKLARPFFPRSCDTGRIHQVHTNPFPYRLLSRTSLVFP